MADFNKAFDITMGNEGGLANNPNDAGGLTYKGITFRDWPDWSGWQDVKTAMGKYGVTNFTDRILAANGALQSDVRAFYKRYYWDVNKLDQVTNQAVANELFDTGVNMGVKTAALFLQKSLNALNAVGRYYPNIDVDGIVGPKTIGYTNNHPNPKALLKMLNGYQIKRYIELIEKNETQEVFANSWLSRVMLA